MYKQTDRKLSRRSHWLLSIAALTFFPLLGYGQDAPVEA